MKKIWLDSLDWIIDKVATIQFTLQQCGWKIDLNEFGIALGHLLLVINVWLSAEATQRIFDLCSLSPKTDIFGDVYIQP